MTEENTDETLIETQVRVESVDGSAIKDATAVRLIIEGAPEVIMALSELVLAYLQAALGAQIVGARDGEGNPLAFGPEVIDILTTGDDPVAE